FLSRYQLSVCVLEKEEDVCSGTSKANSAIVHAGFDAQPGTAKARFNVSGSRMMEVLSQKLDFAYRRNGSMVVTFEEAGRPQLVDLRERGKKNGVEGLRIVDGAEARHLEPALSEEVRYALVAPTGAIVCPFEMTCALAENAAANGAEFRFLSEVTAIHQTEGGFAVSVLTARGETEILQCRYIVNAAGVHSDTIHNMLGPEESRISIIPRKGDYLLMDREAGGTVSHTIFQLPGANGKGVLVTPTVHGNLLAGPTANDVPDKDQTATTSAELADVTQKARKSVPGLPTKLVITSFAGLRAHRTDVSDDFLVGERTEVPGFYDAAGIESPGLSAAPAIGVYLAQAIAGAAGAGIRADWIAERKGILKPQLLSEEERAALIRREPVYGSVVCRCEGVTEGEILDAIRRKPGAVSLDGIKRRVRAGMGRCQAGFCTPRTIELLARELGIPEEQVCKNRPGSELLSGRLEDRE
ncbi:MAG: NAD(P)/FAD-dependent oxidoreductase, partial [Butyrivibrio sp.]|nr:NAD(P)/FAD-dependent oxidoreductase [Butyrivibrio sp.]